MSCLRRASGRFPICQHAKTTVCDEIDFVMSLATGEVIIEVIPERILLTAILVHTFTDKRYRVACSRLFFICCARCCVIDPGTAVGQWTNFFGTELTQPSRKKRSSAHKNHKNTQLLLFAHTDRKKYHSSPNAHGRASTGSSLGLTRNAPRGQCNGKRWTFKNPRFAAKEMERNNTKSGRSNTSAKVCKTAVGFVNGFYANTRADAEMRAPRS